MGKSFAGLRGPGGFCMVVGPVNLVSSEATLDNYMTGRTRPACVLNPPKYQISNRPAFLWQRANGLKPGHSVDA